MTDVVEAIDPRLVADLAEKGMLTALYADLKPDRIAVRSPRGQRTYAELHRNANRLAAALGHAGLVPGDHIALLCPNVVEFVEVLCAVWRSGLRLTPINWRLSAPEAAYIVADCTAKAFIAHADFAPAALASVNDTLTLKLAIGGSIEGFQSYAETLARQTGADPAHPVHGGTMMYTSGTTGRPKGVYRARTFAIPPAWGPNSVKGYRMDEDVELCCGPAYHAAPLAFDIAQPVNAGVSVVFMEKFDPEDFLRTVETYKVTHVHMVATMFQRLLALPQDVKAKYDISSLRHVLHGAAPTPPQIKHAMIAWLGPILFEYYAASEGGGNFTIDSHEWLTKPGSVGRWSPESGALLLDDDGKPIETPGVVGLIYFPHNPIARFEYFNDKAKTKAAELAGGAHFTVGDMGYVDEDGYLFLTGRTAECIISGGVNIYPQEVDNELVRHPAVRETCTVGVPNEEWGEEVRAVIALSPGYAPSEALAKELLDFIRPSLAGFKMPRKVDFVDDIPRSEAGKVQRRQVRAPYWAGRDKQTLMASRALVLSGGGPVGIAWESGLIGGLAKAGVDVSSADFILGTSAGAYVGSRLALGTTPEALAAPYLSMEDEPPPKAEGGPEQRAPNLGDLIQKIEQAQGAGKSAGGVRAVLGAYALEAKTISEDAFIKSFGRSFSALAEDAWPTRRFACTAVDTADGAFRLWTAEDRVGLARAVASSCSVPGIYPPVTIAGRRYMDGGVRSGTNADHAAGYDRVLIVAIRAGAEGPLAEHAKRALGAEVRTLREAGAEVQVVYPDQGSLDAFGSNMMDGSRRPAAAKAGYAQGLAGAAGLKGLW